MLKRNREPGVSRFAYEDLDRVIHERARLSVVTCLATHSRSLSFNELKQLCALTDGNLNRHLRVLEEAKVVTIAKSSGQSRPQTSVKLTAMGRKRFQDYLLVLERILLETHSVAPLSDVTIGV